MSKDNIVRLVDSATHEQKPGLQLNDFVAYMPMHNYIFKPTRETWPASSVNARVNLGDKKASEWLDKNAAVEQATWVPGKPMLIPGKIISDGGWIDAPDCTLFNLYRPPSMVPKSGEILGPTSNRQASAP